MLFINSDKYFMRVFEDLLDDIQPIKSQHKNLADEQFNPEDYMFRVDVYSKALGVGYWMEQYIENLFETHPIISEYIKSEGDEFVQVDFLGQLCCSYYFNVDTNSVAKFFDLFLFPLCKIIRKFVVGVMLNSIKADSNRVEQYCIPAFTATALLDLCEGQIVINKEDVFNCYAFVVEALHPDLTCERNQGILKECDLAGAQYDFLFNVAHSRKWKEEFRKFKRENGVSICPVKIEIALEPNAFHSSYSLDDQTLELEYNIQAKNYIEMAIKLQVVDIIIDNYLCFEKETTDITKHFPTDPKLFEAMRINSSSIDKMILLLKDTETMVKHFFVWLLNRDYSTEQALTGGQFKQFDTKLKLIAEAPLNYKLL